jgi:hypothetical protein
MLSYNKGVLQLEKSSERETLGASLSYSENVFCLITTLLIQLLNNKSCSDVITYLKAHVKCCAGIYVLEVTIFLSGVNMDLIVHSHSR